MKETFNDWVLRSFYEHLLSSGYDPEVGTLPEYSQKDLKTIRILLSNHGMHLKEDLIFCLWSEWSSRFDAGWVSLGTDPGTEVKYCAKHFLKQWNASKKGAVN